MGNVSALIQCCHCGHKTVWIEHDYETDKSYPYDTDEVSQVITYKMLMCKTCLQPTLLKIDKAFAELDGEWLGSNVEEVLYPPPLQAITNLPESVERRYLSALKVRYVEPNAFAVMVGKTLEAVCKHENAQGQNLGAKLQYLATNNRIPQILMDMARHLKLFRNIGAHDDEDNVTENDVPSIQEFLEAILEYLYVAPANVEAVRIRLNKTKTN